MKKIKKSEIAIYAISLMLVTAGYFNYSMIKPEMQETYSEEVSKETEEYANVGDAVLVSNNELLNDIKEEKKELLQEENDNDINRKAQEENIEEKNEEQENKDTENYYANSRLERNVMFAELIASYQEILNNKNVSEVQKSIANRDKESDPSKRGEEGSRDWSGRIWRAGR